MAISINQPSSSLSLIDQLTKKREEQDEKIASGKRINSAADDAAGLQIASRLTSQINGYSQLSFNAQDDVNVNNVQGAQLSSIDESLQRANVLSVQSGSSLSDPDAIQGEFDQLTEEINTLAEEVFGTPNFLTGLDASDPVATQTAIEDAFKTINDSNSALGAESNALESQVSTYETSVINVSASRSRIEDTDFAKTTAEQQQINTLLQATIINKKDEESRKGLLFNKVI
ncbi:MAG: flagellin [Colwellia sp.]|nr:flagellin [Colwellia sp.]